MHHRQTALPVISGRQECPHGGDLSPPGAPSLAGARAPLCGGMRGNVHQVTLDAVDNLSHKWAHVLPQDSDQATEEVARSG